MTFRVHALRKGVVVALLQRSCCGMRSAAAGKRTACKSYACAHRRSLMASEQRAGRRADGGADDSAFHRVVGGGLVGGFSAHLRVRVHAALGIIEAELVEALSGSGKDEYPGAGGRRRGATREQQHGKGRELFHLADGGAGGTRCQPLGHSFT